MSTKSCPYCFSDTGIRIIFYGLPTQEPDPAIYTIGGCLISENMPEYECIECHWKGSKAEVRRASRIRRFIYTDKDLPGITFKKDGETEL